MSIKLSNIANSSIVVGRCYQKLWISEREKIITIFTILHTHSIDMKYMHTHDNSNKGNVKLIICHNKLWIILKEMGIPNHLTCLLRNLYAGQEATVRTGHGTTDWFQIGKGVHQGYILSHCLFNLYAEYIMWHAGLDEAQLESRLPGKISITSDMQMTPPLWQKVKKN